MPPELLRAKRVVVLMCSDEPKKLRNAARKEGKGSVSEWARDVLLKAAKGR